jgi:hypothetical protein
MKDQLLRVLDDLGAEPLAGSGFEDEMPDPEFSASEARAPDHEERA